MPCKFFVSSGEDILLFLRQYSLWTVRVSTRVCFVYYNFDSLLAS